MKVNSYCSTLVFDPNFEKVLVIKKKKGPAWLIGKYTGVGGEVEDGEQAGEAAPREIKEETGLVIENNILPYAKVTRKIGLEEISKCIMFVTTYPILEHASAQTDEEIFITTIAHLTELARTKPETIAPDLMWLVHMGLSTLHIAKGTAPWDFFEIEAA